MRREYFFLQNLWKKQVKWFYKESMEVDTITILLENIKKFQKI